jgi:hypothetical protein
VAFPLRKAAPRKTWHGIAMGIRFKCFPSWHECGILITACEAF